MSSAIVVDVGNPEANCLIDMPFEKALDPVFHAIQMAANGVRLRPVRLDREQKGGLFAEQIVQLTQSARVVIAVCTPQGKSGVPNENVMYEAGLARALGKPTLILTTDSDTPLPANIRHIAALTYDPAESVNALASKIENEMRQILDGLTNDLTSPRHPDIWVARARQRMLLKPQFWKSFGFVFTYANRVRNEIEGLFRDYAHDIERLSKEIADSAEPQGYMGEFHGVWRHFMTHYGQLPTRLQAPPGDLRNALGELYRLGGADTGGQVGLIERYYALVESNLERFHRAHLDAAASCDAFLPGSWSVEPWTKFHVRVSEFVDAAKALIRSSNELVDKMVDMVASGFEEADVPGRFPKHAVAGQGDRP